MKLSVVLLADEFASLRLTSPFEAKALSNCKVPALIVAQAGGAETAEKGPSSDGTAGGNLGVAALYGWTEPEVHDR